MSLQFLMMQLRPQRPWALLFILTFTFLVTLSELFLIFCIEYEKSSLFSYAFERFVSNVARTVKRFEAVGFHSSYSGNRCGRLSGLHLYSQVCTVVHRHLPRKCKTKPREKGICFSILHLPSIRHLGIINPGHKGALGKY